MSLDARPAINGLQLTSLPPSSEGRIQISAAFAAHPSGLIRFTEALGETVFDAENTQIHLEPPSHDDNSALISATCQYVAEIFTLKVNLTNGSHKNQYQLIGSAGAGVAIGYDKQLNEWKTTPLDIRMVQEIRGLTKGDQGALQALMNTPGYENPLIFYFPPTEERIGEKGMQVIRRKLGTEITMKKIIKANHPEPPKPISREKPPSTLFGMGRPTSRSSPHDTPPDNKPIHRMAEQMYAPRVLPVTERPRPTIQSSDLPVPLATNQVFAAIARLQEQAYARPSYRKPEKPSRRKPPKRPRTELNNTVGDPDRPDPFFLHKNDRATQRLIDRKFPRRRPHSDQNHNPNKEKKARELGINVKRRQSAFVKGADMADGIDLHLYPVKIDALQNKAGITYTTKKQFKPNGPSQVHDNRPPPASIPNEEVANNGTTNPYLARLARQATNERNFGWERFRK